MGKYNTKIVKEMSDWIRENGLIDYGGAKLGDFCRAFGIDDVTYYNWMRKSEFSESIKKAKEDFRGNLEISIVKSLANVARGYEYTQTQTEYKDVNGVPKIVKQTKKNVRVEPNVGAAIFLLTNIAPDKWRNKINSEPVPEVKPADETPEGTKYDITAIPSETLVEIAYKLQDAEYEKRIAE